MAGALRPREGKLQQRRMPAISSPAHLTAKASLLTPSRPGRRASTCRAAAQGVVQVQQGWAAGTALLAAAGSDCVNSRHKNKLPSAAERATPGGGMGAGVCAQAPRAAAGQSSSPDGTGQRAATGTASQSAGCSAGRAGPPQHMSAAVVVAGRLATNPACACACSTGALLQPAQPVLPPHSRCRRLRLCCFSALLLASVWGESWVRVLVVRMLCDSSMMTTPHGSADMQ